MNDIFDTELKLQGKYRTKLYPDRESLYRAVSSQCCSCTKKDKGGTRPIYALSFEHDGLRDAIAEPLFFCLRSKRGLCLEFSLGSYNDPIPSQIPEVVPLDVPSQLVALALAFASIRSLDSVGLRARLS